MEFIKRLNALPLDLQYFSTDPSGGAEPNGGTDPGANPGGQDPKGQPGGTGDPEPTPGEKTFTQEDVNNVVTKEARAAQEKLLKQLGIEDFDNAKEGMKKFQEWQDAQKTDAEKQAEKLGQLEQTHADVQSENETLKAQISAAKAGVTTDAVEDVVLLANSLVSDEVDIDTAIKQVIEKYPHFAEETQEEGKPGFSKGVHSRNPGATEPKSLAEALAQKFK